MRLHRLIAVTRVKLNGLADCYRNRRGFFFSNNAGSILLAQQVVNNYSKY